jgi:hypothetical protein
MRVRVEVEKTLKYTDFVELEVKSLNDNVAFVATQIVSNRHIPDQFFDGEELEVIGVTKIGD